MLRDLRDAIAKDADRDQEDFRQAARVLLNRQFVFVHDEGSSREKRAYRLVRRHFGYFQDLFHALGWRLIQDETFEFVGVVPDEGEIVRKLNKMETLLLLAFGFMFEDGLERGEVEGGTVWVTPDDIANFFRYHLHRDPPGKVDLKDHLSTFKNNGLIRTKKGGDFADLEIELLPSLRTLLSQGGWDQRIEAFVTDLESGQDASTGEEGAGEASEALGEDADVGGPGASREGE